MNEHVKIHLINAALEMTRQQLAVKKHPNIPLDDAKQVFGDSLDLLIMRYENMLTGKDNDGRNP